MKKIIISLVFTLLTCATAYAQIRVFVEGDAVRIDPSGFPPKMREAYALMVRKCNQCHTIQRLIIAAQTGICPVSKVPLNKNTSEELVVRMYSKPGANMTKQEARAIWEFINFMLDHSIVVIVKE